MTLFAVAMAGLYPILHLGRPWFFYWLLPLPNTQMHWPQWRSPLVWDFAAISTYATVSLLFWYMGLMPGSRRPARPRQAARNAGLLRACWRSAGAARPIHWARYETVYFLMAALATPLVVSVHSIVALDFTFAIAPGYHSTIFPPYFVAGALLSGFAMVLTIAIPLRWAFSVEDLITLQHMDNAAKLMIASGMVVVYGYASEAFFAWYSGEAYERMMMVQRAVGPYSVLFWTMLVLQLRRAATAVVAPRPSHHAVAVHGRAGHQHRHVDRALRHRRQRSEPRLPALGMGRAIADLARLRHPVRVDSAPFSRWSSCSSASCPR